MVLNGTIKYKKGALVTSIRTDSKGYAKTGDLLLGKYRISEVASGANSGFVLADDRTVTLSLSSSLSGGAYL